MTIIIIIIIKPFGFMLILLTKSIGRTIGPPLNLAVNLTVNV